MDMGSTAGKKKGGITNNIKICLVLPLWSSNACILGCFKKNQNLKVGPCKSI